MADRIERTLELVRRSHGGDREALDELLARYYPRVLKVIRLRLGAKLRGRTESMDVLQETFAAAVRLFDRFEMRNEASFINWLSKIAERTIGDMADEMNAQKRDPRREAQSAGSVDLLAGVEAGVAVPLDDLIAREEQGLVEHCLAELPEPWRETLVLRNWIGLSFDEIARETQRPTEGAARVMHAKAMRELVRRVRGRTRLEE